MAVTETLRALGNWGVRLSDQTPKEILDKLKYFGHVTLHTGRVDPRVAGDSLLTSSRYTGVLRKKIGKPDGTFELGGPNVAVWLGDEEGKGKVIETLLTFTAQTFHTVVPALLPTAVTAGTIFNIGQSFTGTFQYVTPRQAIDYVCQTLGAEWRVNSNATLDAGLESNLFVTTPKAMVAKRRSGKDLSFKAFEGLLQTEQDVEDFTTRVLLLASDAEGSYSTGDADILPGLNPYKDLYGNAVALTRLVNETGTDPANAEARAQLQLNRFTGTRDALTLSSKEYDIRGDLAVGDYLWVFDPDLLIFDMLNEAYAPWGQLVNPMKLRLTEMTYPITKNMSLAYRDWTGNWYDLTDYFIPESGDTTLVVGGYNRSLTSDGGDGGAAVAPPPAPNLTIPGVVSWSPPFNQSVYQSPVTGETRAEIELKWLQPTNTDLSNVTDGDHYEIRYRMATTPLFPVTIDQTAGSTLAQLNTVDEPIVYAATDWQYAYVPWSSLKFRLQELTPSMPYEAQIRAIDTGTPPNLGAWSALMEFQASRDILPPATPAPPEVAASTISVQVVHRLGRADGGEFNLDRDLHHLEVHGEYEAGFEPSQATLIGKMVANWGMITGEIPVVAGFQISSILPVFFKVVAVDESGNKSLPSSAVKQTADLIQDQYVQNLTVTKITAGTISADWIIGSYIRTGTSGPRVELSYAGIDGFGTTGAKQLEWSSDTGQLSVLGEGGIKVTGGGNVEITDGAVIVYNAAGQKIVELGECADGRHGLQVYKDNGTRVARVGELESSVDEGIEFRSDTGVLVRANTLAFGTAASTVTAVEATSSTSFVNLATVGPFVTVELGNSARMLVVVSCSVTSTTSGGGNVAFDIAGPSGYFLGANALTGWYGGCSSGGSGPFLQGGSKVFLVTGLPSAGLYTVQLKYRSNGASSCQFFDRHVSVIPY